MTTLPSWQTYFSLKPVGQLKSNLCGVCFEWDYIVYACHMTKMFYVPCLLKWLSLRPDPPLCNKRGNRSYKLWLGLQPDMQTVAYPSFSSTEPTNLGELIYGTRVGDRPSVHTFKHEYLWDQLSYEDQISSGASLWWGIDCIKFPWQQIAPIGL